MAAHHLGLTVRSVVLALTAVLGISTANAQVVISSSATQNMSCLGGVCAPTASSAVLNVNDLENMLASGNVDVTTTGSGVQADNIEVQSTFSWSSSNSLTLDAYQSVGVSGAVAIQGSGGVSLITNDGGSGGSLLFSPGGDLTFAKTSNALSIDGQSYVLEKSLKALATAIGKHPSGLFALSRSAKAGRPYKNAPITTTFSGTLNGLGNAIKRLTIHIGDKTRSENVGLFAELGSGGAINSLLLQNTTINISEGGSDFDSVGAMVGVNNGNLSNDYASGVISVIVRDEVSAGGLVGTSVGDVLASAASVSLNLTAGNNKLAIAESGGIIGSGTGMIEMSYATGNTKTAGLANALSGGLVGNGGTIENCYATGSTAIPGAESAYVGGLVGVDSLPVTGSYSTGAPSTSAQRF